MARRKTTVGVGAFGRPVHSELHEWEIIQRIIDKRLPLTEDAVFVLLACILRRNNQSTILKCVRSSRNTGDYRYFTFSPDIDLLEIRENGIIAGYELKGYTKSGRSQSPPAYYEGIDEALAYLVNPLSTPMSNTTFAGSIFDYVYLVHPASIVCHSGLESLKSLLGLCTPVGLVSVDYSRVKELVKPKRNPMVRDDVKQLFLRHLEAFRSCFQYRLNLVQ